ncbi:SCO3374 family protein [Streptomyces sp. MRC013]|uniref:SCO3374 family protein n=1 Tax=Streptomyces sp. MRC013 TaxID=2898276 RepID=UPI0020276A43|nr:SCO3374 family protein [Streptomyces sp. MRC013]URM90266.1 SCO3374 family protein [Streptomyces sp. MRC013]
MAATVPASRAPLAGHRPGGSPVARWYEEELGWTTTGGSPVRLPTGLRFDVLDLPAPAGLAVVRRVRGDWPVAVAGRRARILVAAGSAGELPGLLDWLEWGGVGLDLAARGAGGRMTAPVPPGWDASGAPGGAVWLRPPDPGREVEATLVGLPGAAGRAGVPDGSGLVRLVAAAAVECHRAGLLAAGARDRTRSRGAARG